MALSARQQFAMASVWSMTPLGETYRKLSPPWLSELVVERDDRTGFRWRASVWRVLIEFQGVVRRLPIAEWDADNAQDANIILLALLEGVGAYPERRLGDTYCLTITRSMSDVELTLAGIAIA